MNDAVEEEISSGFDRDHLIANVATAGVVAFDDATAVNSASDDGEVLDVFAPHQGIVKMAVAEILILFECVWLRWIVSVVRSGDHRVFIEDQADIALQMD